MCYGLCFKYRKIKQIKKRINKSKDEIDFAYLLTLLHASSKKGKFQVEKNETLAWLYD